MLDLHELNKTSITEILQKHLKVQKEIGETLTYVSNHLHELNENTKAIQKLDPDKIDKILDFQYAISTFFFEIKAIIVKTVYVAISMSILYGVYYIVGKWGLKCF